MRSGLRLTLGAAVFISAGATEALAQKAAPNIRDAVYRGTLVCGKLGFIHDPVREAIEVTVSGPTIRYIRALRTQTGMAGAETGTGTIEAGKISLKGSWKSGADSYEATYSGTFVRRSAKLSGAQVWSHDGKTYTRTCSGAIKRPLAAFLPKGENKGEKKN